MFLFQRAKSNCENCPFRDTRKVFGRAPIDKPLVAVFGEAPGAEEDRRGEPFVGPAGGKLQWAVAQSGLLWHQVYRSNALLCRPPNNKIDTIEASVALDCCRPGFKEEIDALVRNGVRVFVPLGNTAAGFFDLEGSITTLRGSVWPYRGACGVATFHPSYLLQGGQAEEPTWINDLAKARRIAISGWSPPEENFNLFPNFTDVAKFVEDAIAKKSFVSVDIEASSLDTRTATVWMVGLSTSATSALVIPFYSKGRIPYWPSHIEPRVWKLLSLLFKSVPLGFQNAMYDVRVLAHRNVIAKNIEHDIMLLHHAINPELKHNLGYITSVYGDTPYWKDLKLNHERAIDGLEDSEYRTYNARDCVVIHQNLPRMLEHAEENGVMSTYRNISMKLIWPFIRMMERGIPVSIDTLKAFVKKLKKYQESYDGALRDLANLPPYFNFNSPDQVRYLLYGTKPRTLVKTKEALDEYETNLRKSKETKAYKKLFESYSIYTDVEPLRSGSSATIGGGSTKRAALIAILKAANDRALAIGNLVRPNDGHTTELEKIGRLQKFLALFGIPPDEDTLDDEQEEYMPEDEKDPRLHTYKGVSKLLSIYGKYPVAEDGRVHGEYLIHGTKTGRPSSRKPNRMNDPEDAKHIFVSDGYFIHADYSNLELRVLACLAKISLWLDAFAEGKKIHDINVKFFFGIERDDPHFDEWKRLAKTLIFGLNYGGSVPGIYSRLVATGRPLPLSLPEFKAAVERYYKAVPEYAAYRERIIATAMKTRCAENAFGRKRYLLGPVHQIPRLALNTPVQGTAADIANTAIIQLDSIFEELYHDKAWLCGTVYDSIDAESILSETYVRKCGGIMKDIMEQPFTVNGISTVFPVEIQYGRSLGKESLKPLEL